MNLDKFTGSGSTPSRRAFWDNVADAVLSSQKREGRNASVDEHEGQGTVINFPDQTPSPPQMGACCTDGVCSILSESDCVDGGGNFLGNGSTCDDVDCTMGACCLDGVCSITTQEECTGEYQGDGTTCEGVDCGEETSGACCVGTDCSILSPTDCAEAGGVYQGDDTICEEVDCTNIGACCHSDGSCTITTSEGCDGTYLGNGTTCTMGACDVTGTCCYDVDTCARSFSCTSIDATGCAMLGGHFDSNGQTCFDRCVCLDSFNSLSCGSCFHGPCAIECDDFGGTPYECCSQGGGFSWNCLTCGSDGCRDGVGCEEIVGCTGTCFGGCIESTAEDCECACPGGSVTLTCGGC